MRKPSQASSYLKAVASRQTTTAAALADQKAKSDAILEAGGQIANFENRHFRRTRARQERRGVSPRDFVLAQGGII